MNTASIITSFNPFFRYDGYWIFSDYFQIQNLREKSTTANDLMKNPHKTFIKAQKSLFIYSVANVFFWAYVYFAVGKYIILKFSSLTEIIGTGNFLSFDFSQNIVFYGIRPFGNAQSSKKNHYSKK